MLNSQTGISIAAVIIAIVAIGISASLVSLMNQDISDLKFTINEISSRGEIDQQGFGIAKLGNPSKNIKNNVTEESILNNSLFEKLQNIPFVEYESEIHELQKNVKLLQYKTIALDERLDNAKLKADPYRFWKTVDEYVDPGDYHTFNLECSNEDDAVLGYSVKASHNQVISSYISERSPNFEPSVTVFTDDTLLNDPIHIEVFYSCVRLETDSVLNRAHDPDIEVTQRTSTETTNRPVDQQGFGPTVMGSIIKGTQDDKSIKGTQSTHPNPLKSSEKSNLPSKQKIVLDHDICGDGIDNDSDGQIDEIEAPQPGVNWSFCDLSNQDYSNENLKGAKLIRTSGSNVNLHGADFTNAVLINSIFTNSDLVAIFVNANLKGVTMEHSNFNGAHLINSTLNNGDFNHSTFDGASLQGASIRSSQFNDASLVNANLENVVGFGNGSFERANLSDVNLKHANLQQWTLTEADVTIADLSYADFNGVDSTYTDYSDSNLHAFDGGWGDFSYSKFINTDLSGARLTAANFIMVDFTNADLTSAQMVYANLIDSNLSDADLSYANLSGADLTGADLTDAVLIGTNLISSNLNEVNLSGADLTGADLTDAILSCIGHPICN